MSICRGGPNGRPDVLIHIHAVDGRYFEAGLQPLVELARLFGPATVFLGHHDGPGVAQWAANYPAALALRDALPSVRTMDVLYRTPVYFSTTSKEMFTGW
jgi:hypothetical protein